MLDLNKNLNFMKYSISFSVPKDTGQSSKDTGQAPGRMGLAPPLAHHRSVRHILKSLTVNFRIFMRQKGTYQMFPFDHSFERAHLTEF